MAAIERTYNVPLRKGFSKVPKYKKTKKAVLTLKEFLARHMKCPIEDVRLGKQLNQTLWARGYKYPPHHVKLTVIKSDDGKVKAELFGFKYEEPIKPAEKTAKDTKAKEETEKEIKDLKKEVEKVIDVDKVEEPAEKLAEKKERKPRAKKAETKEEKAEDSSEAKTEEKPKKERKPRAKKTETKEEKAE